MSLPSFFLSLTYSPSPSAEALLSKNALAELLQGTHSEKIGFPKEIRQVKMASLLLFLFATTCLKSNLLGGSSVFISAKTILAFSPARPCLLSPCSFPLSVRGRCKKRNGVKFSFLALYRNHLEFSRVISPPWNLTLSCKVWLN